MTKKEQDKILKIVSDCYSGDGNDGDYFDRDSEVQDEIVNEIEGKLIKYFKAYEQEAI